jgi:CheY-like chemotaxis protein
MLIVPMSYFLKSLYAGGVLQDLKQDDELKKIPVVVLTTSKAEQDIVKSYELGANSFLTKPVEIIEFVQVVASPIYKVVCTVHR